MMIKTCNPTTAQLIHQYPTFSSTEVNDILNKTQTAFNSWHQTSIDSRSNYLQRIATLLRERSSEYATLIAQEMGKPIEAGIKEIEKCAWVCAYYAEMAPHFLKSKFISTEYQTSYVCYQALGIILAIMPWNFPFWQVFRFAAPNLMVGNAVILRHAEITTGCGLMIEQLMREAELPEHVFRTVILTHETTNELIQHELIRGVTLTGSPQAGSHIASTAGHALKKVVLELGGNDAYLILNDADLELAARICVNSRLTNSGQVCIAAKRIIVEEAVYDQFQDLILAQISEYCMGDPLDPSTHLGPLARKDLRDQVHQQVLANIAKGAQLITGGYIPSKPGFFYPPTLLGKITSDMPIMKEEIFGPIISLIPAKNVDEAVTLANKSQYGLGAAVFTRNLELGENIAKERLQAGVCHVNCVVTSDPRLPFGGIKQSGFGRELGVEGLHEFVNIKTVCVK